jgi:hypothetical protein
VVVQNQRLPIIQISNFSVPSSYEPGGREFESLRARILHRPENRQSVHTICRVRSNSRHKTCGVRRQRREAAMAVAHRASRASARPRGRRPRSNLSGRAFYTGPRTVNRCIPFVALGRTPDIKHAEFDDSAAKRRWRSPIGRAERQRGQGAEGPAAIFPGAHFIMRGQPTARSRATSGAPVVCRRCSRRTMRRSIAGQAPGFGV